MSNALATLTSTLARKLDMGDGSNLIETLKATAFKGQVSDSQMTALLVVANQYALNPWTKEIYAFPDKQNGIVPVVGVDGWSRIINTHAQFDGIEFEQDEKSCTCIIYRKDRTRPIKVTEWMDECKRGTGPWQSHPRRMLRHKAMIQCARLAFGYGGIYDQDEAERIIEVQGARAEPAHAAVLPFYESADDFQKDLEKWRGAVSKGKVKSMQDALERTRTRYTLTQEQEAQFMGEAAPVRPDVHDVQDATPKTVSASFDQIVDAINQAQNFDELERVSHLIPQVKDEAEAARLIDLFNAKEEAFPPFE